MAGLPGSMPAIRSVSRTKGERDSTAGGVNEAGSLLAVIMAMRLQGGPRPAVQGLPHNKEGEVKTRLTIGNFGDFWPRRGKKSQKRETPDLSNRGLGRRG